MMKILLYIWGGDRRGPVTYKSLTCIIKGFLHFVKGDNKKFRSFSQIRERAEKFRQACKPGSVPAEYSPRATAIYL
jgi:hypothetical protein